MSALKNLNSLCVSAAFIFSGSARAAAEGNPFNQQSLSIILSLIVVLAVIVSAALLLKKFNLGMTGIQRRELRVVATLPLGPKERLIVVDVNGEQLLLGVTAQSINHLQTLTQPLPEKATATGDFSQKLQQFIKKE